MSIKRQTLWNMSPTVVAAISGFISMPLFVRFLGTENYAVWYCAMLCAGMFGFADFGLGVAVGRYMSMALGQGDREAVRSYWGTGNAIVIPVLVLMAMTLAGIGCWLGPKWYKVAEHAALFRFCILAISVEMLFSYYSQYWLILSQAHLDFRFVGSLRATMILVRTMPALALAFLTHSPLIMAYWFSLAALIELIIFVWHGHKIYQLGLEFSAASLARIKEMSGFLGKNFVSLISGSFFSQIDRNILGHTSVSAASFSYYSVAASLSSRLQSVSLSVMGPVFYNASRAAGAGGQTPPAAVYNESFRFIFGWYSLVAAWVMIWHPVFIYFYLVRTMGVEKGTAAAALVGPLLVPLVLAACFGALFNISSAQLASLNRLGTNFCFNVAAGLLAIAGVWAGWHFGGVQGAAWGFLSSRIVLVAQDVYTAHLINAQGWWSWHTLSMISGQALVAIAFASGYLFLPAESIWMLLLAILHGGLVAGWLLRNPLSRWIARWGLLPLNSSAIKP